MALIYNDFSTKCNDMVALREAVPVRAFLENIPQLFYYKERVVPRSSAAARPIVNTAASSSAVATGGSKRNDYRKDYIANEGTRGTKFKNATGLDNCLNSCYANTTLQTFARIGEFVKQKLRKKPDLSVAQSELYVLRIYILISKHVRI